MGISRRWGAVALLAVFLVPLVPLPVAADGEGPSREPTALTPLSFSVPFVYRTMEGLQTTLISPLPTYDHLHAVAFAPDGHMAIAVGSHNTLVGFDPLGPNAWILRNGTLGNLYGVAWSDDSQSALAVGWNGALVLYTASGIQDLSPEGFTEWRGVAFVPGSGFLVVGLAGGIFFLNGTTRTPVLSPTTNDLFAVAYSSVLGRAVAVGRGGVVVEITPAGAASLVASPVTDDLRAVGFESDTGKGLIAGGGSLLLSYVAGAVANETHAATDGAFYSIAVTGSDLPAAVAIRNATGGSILFTNASFSNWVGLGTSLTGVLAVARIPGSSDVLATGFSGMVTLVSQDGTVTNVSSGYRPPLTDGDWNPAGTKALFVGFNGTVLLFDRLSNSSSLLAVPDTNKSLRGVSWAANGSEALIVGGNAVWLYEASSGNVTSVNSTPPDLYAVAYRPGGSFAVVVGAGGFIGRWEAGALTQVPSPITQGLLAVRWHVTGGVGDYVAATGANIVVEYDGVSAPTSVTRIGTFYGVGFLGDDTWIVGRRGQIQRYDDNVGIWDNVTLPSFHNNTTFTRVVTVPSGDALLVVASNTTVSMYMNLTKIIQFDTGFFASFNGVMYNPVTDEPTFYGASSLAFSMRTGTFPNLPPSVVVSSPANGTNWTDADTITFDASSSFDLDGDPLRITWWDDLNGFLTTGASFAAQLSAGNHTVTVFVDDGQGHNVSSSVSLSVSVFEWTPVAVIDSPTASSDFSADDDITFSGATSYDANIGDVLSYVWRVDGTPIGTNSIVVARVAAGTHTVTLNVTDQTGRSSEASVLIAVRAGNAPPAPVILSPQPGGAFASNIPILFDATGTSDPDSPSLTYLWLDNGVEIGRAPIMNATLEAGTHTITLQVSDGAKTSQLVVTIDVGGPTDLPPRFLTISPANGTVLVGTVVLSGTVENDTAGPVRFVQYRIENGNLETAIGISTWQAVVDTTALPNGTITITFRASDSVRFTEETRTYVVANPFVNEPPVVDIFTPVSGTYVRGTVAIGGSAEDTDTVISAVEFRVGQGAWTPADLQGTSWTASFDASGLPNGPVILEVRAFDGYNYSESAFVTVNVDNPGQGDGGLSGPTLAIAALGIVAAAVLAVVLLRRRRG